MAWADDLYYKLLHHDHLIPGSTRLLGLVAAKTPYPNGLVLS